MPTTPLYRRIAAELREGITSGKLRPGEQLLTEQELMDQYRVSRNTVRLALGQLANEGMITSTQGRGTFVRERVMLTYHATRAEAADKLPAEGGDAYFTEVRAQGREPSQAFETRLAPASLAVAERLSLEEGEAVVVRRLTRFVDGEPWSVQSSSYPMDIAQECGLMVPRDIPSGTIRVMAEHGYLEVGHHDEVTARMPTPDELRTLELGSGVPVLVYVRTAYTKQRPIRLTETVFPSDRNRLVYELGDLDALYERDAP